MSAAARSIRALVRRALNEILRVPGGAIPGVLGPTIFFVGLSGIYGAASQLPGFPTDSFRSFIVPVGFLQAATFAGAATGVNLARDIERGWFNRLVLCPVPRLTLLAGLITSAALRSLLPTTLLVVVAFALGVHWPGLDGLAIAYALELAMACAFACWGISMALRFRTQQAAPLIQMAGLTATLLTPAFAPEEMLAPWLQHVSAVNPAAYAMVGIRQGFVGGVNWEDSWQAAVAVVGLLLLLGTIAVRGFGRVGVRV